MENYVIKDSFMQELKNFDIVAVGVNEGGANGCVLGVYHSTCILIYNDFHDMESRNSALVLKRYNLYNIGKFAGVANRQAIEIGELGGEFQLRGAIKIDNPTEDMLIFRAKLLYKLQKGEVTSSVTRRFLNKVVADAIQDGRLEED